MNRKALYAVMERCGNFSHTLEEFDTRDQAIQFMYKQARKDAQEQFTDIRRIPEEAYEIELENALSYYSIEQWEVFDEE